MLDFIHLEKLGDDEKQLVFATMPVSYVFKPFKIWKCFSLTVNSGHGSVMDAQAIAACVTVVAVTVIRDSSKLEPRGFAARSRDVTDTN
jgi:hypothetical protein